MGQSFRELALLTQLDYCIFMAKSTPELDLDAGLRTTCGRRAAVSREAFARSQL